MRIVAATLALAVLFAPTSAHAQGDPYKTGVKLENAGDLVGALAAFESIPADKRDFNARLHIAGCKKKLGRLLEAERDYEAIRTDPKADPPTIETAASDLEDLRPRIPKLVVKLSAATLDVKVAVDGQEAKMPATVPVNPGAHSVVATRGDAQVFRRDVTMPESTTIEVEVDAPGKSAAALSPTREPPVASPIAATPAPATSDRPNGTGRRTLGLIGIGAGAALGGAALGAWIYSGKLADDYLENCRNNPPCNKGDESSVRTWETAATIGAGAAIIAAGVGVTLLLTAPKDRAVAVSVTTNGAFVVGKF